MTFIADFADDALRLVEDTTRRAGSLFEPSLRIGVTGLNRAGKTVFITSLVANMLERERMTRLSAQSAGRIEAAMLRPQPNADVPRFEFEDHLAAMTGPDPVWPSSTRRISELRLSIRFRRTGLLAGFAGDGVLHLDIVDYPGEWLLDLPLLNTRWEDWSRQSVEAARRPERIDHAGAYLDWAGRVDGTAPMDEAVAREGAALFADYLKAARKAGLSAISPGRFLMPGDLEGTPAVTFAPLPDPDGPGGSLARLMRDRYEAYRRVVVRPFFQNHFSRVDRQIVLVDALSAIDAGPRAVADLRKAMSDILDCFRHGEKSWLGPIFGRRVERLLFAATKADHVHHTQHAQLQAITTALVRESIERASYKGARVEALALASLRATVEQEVKEGGDTLHCVRGRGLDTGEEVVVFPGQLPDDPSAIVDASRRPGDGAQEGWLSEDYGFMRFAPPVRDGRPGFGPPHLRLDMAAEFLFGDRLS